MMRSFVLLLLCTLPLGLGAQTQQLHEVPADSAPPPRWGINRRHAVFGSLGLGMALGPSHPSAPVVYGLSSTGWLGGVYKLKLSGLLALGAEAQLRYTAYRFAQDSSKTFPSPVRVKHERLSLWGLEAGTFLRLNLDPRRGNIMGKHVDLGLRAQLPVSVVHRTRTTDPDDGSRVVVRRSRLGWHEPLHAWLLLRVGFSYVDLWAAWRPGRLLRERVLPGMPDLPAWQVGLQLNLH